MDSEFECSVFEPPLYIQNPKVFENPISNGTVIKWSVPEQNCCHFVKNDLKTEKNGPDHLENEENG